MRSLVIIVSLFFILGCSGSGKGLEEPCKNPNATITNKAPSCQGWGIVVGGIVYPAKNIPVEFRINGLNVCATYDLFMDPAMCPCCGGTYANILTMSN
jgi:hypothetical protein